MTQASINPSSPSWEVESLRVTAFYPEGTPPQQKGLWKLVTGQEPENRSATPRSGQEVEGGEIGDVELVCHVSPRRTVWRTTAGKKLLELNRTLKPLPESASDFLTLLTPWIENTAPTCRLAFGAILDLPVASGEAGLSKVQSLLPWLKLDPKSDSDFLFHLNRPTTRKAAGEAIVINRLCKWSVATLALMTIEATGLALQTTKGKQNTVVRLELDVNTVVSHVGNWQGKALREILGVLASIAQEVANRGDFS